MAGEGPYLESNQPYNAMPMIGGAVLGGGIAATTAGLGMGAINGGIRGSQRMNHNRIQAKQKSIEKASNRISEIDMQSVSKPGQHWNTKGEKFKASKDDAKALWNQRKGMQSEVKELRNKKHMNKIGGGKMAGVIGGTALVGSLIGGTMGAIANHD